MRSNNNNNNNNCGASRQRPRSACSFSLSLRGGEGTVDRDVVGSNCSTGNRLSSFFKTKSSQSSNSEILSSMRVSNRYHTPFRLLLQAAEALLRTFSRGPLGRSRGLQLRCLSVILLIALIIRRVMNIVVLTI